MTELLWLKAEGRYAKKPEKGTKLPFPASKLVKGENRPITHYTNNKRRLDMNWGFVFWMILSILGAALIAGGIVAHRRSRRTGVRAFGAAAVAAGVVMWAIVAVTIPVSSTQHGSPEPTIHYQESTVE